MCGWSEYLWEPPYGFKYCCAGHGLCEDCYDISFETVAEWAKLPIPEIMEKLGYYPEHDRVRKHLEEAASKGCLEDMIQDLAQEDELSQEFCPICSFEVISERDLKDYLVKVSNITTNTVFQHVKSANKRRKKLYNNEYIAYVCGELGMNTIEIQEEIKAKFESYEEFKGFIR